MLSWSRQTGEWLNDTGDVVVNNQQDDIAYPVPRRFVVSRTDTPPHIRGQAIVAL